jgi:hypothetical protein
MRALKRGSRRGGGRRAGVSVAARRAAPPGQRAAPRRAALRASVLVHPELLRAIADATSAAGDLETGGPLIGTVQRSWTAGGGRPSLIVSLLGTLAPGPALRATGSSVSLGRSADGERAASAIRWWRAVTGLDLIHLGDWHKHEVRSPEPSEGDHSTAKEMRAETAAPLWLTAIAVGGRSDKVETAAEGHRARISRSAVDREHVRFYRAVTGVGLEPVPVRVEAHALPSLPALPWHVADPARFAAECRLLSAAGFSVAIEPSDSRTSPSLKIHLRRDGKPGLTVVTSPNYPAKRPLVRDGNGRRVRNRVPWSPARFLVDLAKESR